MIEVIGNEIYRIASCLEAKLGHEPSKEELNTFEGQCEKALNDLLKTVHTNIYVLMIDMYKFHNAKQVCDSCQGLKVHSIVGKNHPMPENVIATDVRKAVFGKMNKIDQLGSDDTSTPDNTLDFYTHSINSFVDVVNEKVVNVDDYYISYIKVTVETV